jgi:hypothetical protein
MEYDVVLTFRDGIVHKIGCGSDLQAAQDTLKNLGAAKEGGAKFEFFNVEGDIIFTANLDNFQFAFIEINKGEKK